MSKSFRLKQLFAIFLRPMHVNEYALHKSSDSIFSQFSARLLITSSNSFILVQAPKFTDLKFLHD